MWRGTGGQPPPAHLIDADRDRRIGPGYDNEWTPHWIGRPDHEVAVPYYDFEHVRLCTLHGDSVHGHYGRWLAERHADPDSLRGPGNAIADDRYRAPQAWRTRMPEELYPTSYVAGRAIDFLEAHAAGGATAPFFLQCSFPDPHHPYTPPGRYWDMYEPGAIELPASFDAAPEAGPAAYVRAHQRAEAERSPYAPFVASEREAREIIALTYGMVTLIDDAVGRVLARLDALGLADDTVVLFTSDHGDWMGDHGLMLKGPLHYQSLIRVPLLWADPRPAARTAPRTPADRRGPRPRQHHRHCRHHPGARRAGPLQRDPGKEPPRRRRGSGRRRCRPRRAGGGRGRPASQLRLRRAAAGAHPRHRAPPAVALGRAAPGASSTTSPTIPTSSTTAGTTPAAARLKADLTAQLLHETIRAGRAARRLPSGLA